ncbi:permease [Rhizobium sp. RCC_161_2]|uniref:permease n=1 Tax=Rhizobium sp. RCC_161_2 TaxID=3239219 RepID=UPI003526090B
MDADARALKEACRDFEARFGIEAFLDVMAGIMQDRLGDHGLAIQFDGSDEGAQPLQPLDIDEVGSPMPNEGAAG